MSHNHIKKTGIFSNLHNRLRKNRLGELLVLKGSLTPLELKSALHHSRESGQQLGHFLVADHILTSAEVRRTLIEQYTFRIVLTIITLFISFTSMGMMKKASAGQIQDATARISIAQSAFEKASYHPKLFGSTEKKSSSLKAFTKWTTMFQRFNATLNASQGQKEISEFKQEIEKLKGLPLSTMVTRVNDMMNAKRYVSDSANYGQTDYWATPVEFFKRGGDCEDYAIAKYTALKALGVPENRLRIAIVQDVQKNIPHAVLIVYTDRGAVILDNQIKTAISAERIKHYKPIFTINQEAWWLHTAPRGNVTVIASSSQ